MRQQRLAGLTVMEVMVASLAVGLLMMSLFEGLGLNRKSSGRLLNRMSAMSVMTEFTQTLSRPDLLREMTFHDSEQGKLKDCLENACQVGTSGIVDLILLDSVSAGLKPKLSFEVISDTLLELKAVFESSDHFLQAQTISIYVSRKSFMTFDGRSASSCGKNKNDQPNVIVGVDTSGDRFLCRDSTSLLAGKHVRPIVLPIQGFKGEWK